MDTNEMQQQVFCIIIIFLQTVVYHSILMKNGILNLLPYQQHVSRSEIRGKTAHIGLQRKRLAF